jgi:hypothetical protein
MYTYFHLLNFYFFSLFNHLFTSMLSENSYLTLIPLLGYQIYGDKDMGAK